MKHVRVCALVGIPAETTEAAPIETGKRGNDVETGMRSHGDATTAPWFSSNYSACRNIACYLRRGNEPFVLTQQFTMVMFYIFFF